MRYIAICCAVFFLCLQACKKEQFFSKKEYEASYDAWVQFKRESNDSYSYTTIWSSWTGHSGRMIVTVEKGRVVARDYRHIGRDDNEPGVMKVYEEWQEDETNLHTHTNGSVSLTLDEIYIKAKNLWLNVDEKNNTIHFEAKNNGLISSCGYVAKNCADDCFVGITITEIKRKN